MPKSNFPGLLDHILVIAQKSVPEPIASHGNLELWEANKRFVIAGIEMVKILCAEIGNDSPAYEHLRDSALELYQSLIDVEESFVLDITTPPFNRRSLMLTGMDVVGAIMPGVEALEHYDLHDRQMKERNN